MLWDLAEGSLVSFGASGSLVLASGFQVDEHMDLEMEAWGCPEDGHRGPVVAAVGSLEDGHTGPVVGVLVFLADERKGHEAAWVFLVAEHMGPQVAWGSQEDASRGLEEVEVEQYAHPATLKVVLRQA